MDRGLGLSSILAAVAGESRKASAAAAGRWQAGLQLLPSGNRQCCSSIREVTSYSSPQQAGWHSSAVQPTWCLPLLDAPPQLTVADSQTASLPGWRARRDQTAAVRLAWRLLLLQLWGS